jgi:hypothetical protein
LKSLDCSDLQPVAETAARIIFVIASVVIMDMTSARLRKVLFRGVQSTGAQHVRFRGERRRGPGMPPRRLLTPKRRSATVS